MPAMRHITLQKKNGVAILTLNSVDESMNVVSSEWLDEMSGAIAQVKDDASVAGLIITSAKKSFMAGADLKVLVDGYRNFTVKDAYAFSQKATKMHRALETMGKPVVAALNGLALGGGYELALAVEGKYFARLLTDPVARNIIRTTFISKQAAVKGARRPKDIPTATFSKIGVLGAGMMGAGLALVAAQAGLDVVLLDRDVATAQKGKDYAANALAKQVEKGALDRAAADAVLARIHPTENYSDLAGAEFCIEAVFEDAQIKADVTQKAEKAIGASATFATNTSTLPISTLANASKRPDQFIGMHFFSPVERMELVEIIVGKKTSPTALAAALDLAARLRKTPIVVNDSRGFYTSRVFQILINEGAAMLSEGVAPARIENAVKSAGFPVGPLALLDEVTIDLPIKIVETSRAEEGGDYAPAVGLPTMYKMRELGRTSRKSGAGFYEYPAGGKKKLWSGLGGVFPLNAVQPAQDELKKRILFSQAIETARCLEERVLETPQDADLGAVYGWGFPAWTGGTVSYIDTLGLKQFVREADRLAQDYGPRFAPSPWLRALAEKGDSIYEQLEQGGGADRAR